MIITNSFVDKADTCILLDFRCETINNRPVDIFLYFCGVKAPGELVLCHFSNKNNDSLWNY
jgi:hypothetical protein